LGRIGGDTIIGIDLEETRSLLRSGNISAKHSTLLEHESSGRALVAGIGFGRDIHWLLKETALTICAIDHADRLIDDAQKEFADVERVEIQQCDILEIPDSFGKFDIILWMWSGIIDFVGDQKSHALKNIGNCLAKDAILVIETVYGGVKNRSYNIEAVANNDEAKTITLEYNNKKMNVELVSDITLDELATQAGLKRLGEPHLYLDGERQLNFFAK